MRFFILSFALFVSLETLSAAEPQWIWSDKNAATKAAKGVVVFRKTFNAEQAKSAVIEATADNRYEVFVNGRRVGGGEVWQQRTEFNVTPLLVPGRNLIAVRAENDGEDPAGFYAKMTLAYEGKPTQTLATDESWKASAAPSGPWQRAEFDDSTWSAAAALGDYGKTPPWGASGQVVKGESRAPSAQPRSQERGAFELREGDRLVLLGGTFIERMQSDGFFELELQAALGEKNVAIRNLGWSGDTVWGDSRGVFGTRADGFKRLVNDVNLCKPTAILVCYGENEAFAGEAGLAEFESGYLKLLDALEASGARLLLVAPRKHENVGKPFPDQTAYNLELRKYADTIKRIATEREHAFVDWFDLLAGERLTENGLHLTLAGSQRAAPALVGTLTARSSAWNVELDLARRTLSATGPVIEQWKTETDGGLSLSVMNRREHPRTPCRLAVAGLPAGDYEFLLEGRPVPAQTGRHSAAQLAQGIVFSLDDRTDELLSAIAEKNFLFFNRYRPQNETYLFLFRKHEQGNNAVEIPQFDPLIEAKEKEISDLKKPRKYRIELKPVARK